MRWQLSCGLLCDGYGSGASILAAMGVVELAAPSAGLTRDDVDRKHC
jgi:hypothetical protein